MPYFLIILAFLYFSCSTENKTQDLDLYDGPIMEIKDLNTLFSDSAKAKFRLKSDLYQVFESGEEQYPKGLFMDIFSKDSDSISASFKANFVIKFENENFYKATGNVVVLNYITNDELRTEELFWYPNEEKFVTEKFVTIKTGNELHKGEGMISNQDFSNYEILKPSGIIEVDEN